MEIPRHISTFAGVTETIIGLEMKYIWECKTRETLPDFEIAITLASSYFKNVANVSLRMRENIIDSGSSLRILQG
jgi:hypothetical protein